MSCGCADCCAGVEAVTPVPSYNRPGLPALAYRVGTHGSFRESMLARLSSRPALAGLTTREPDDAAIALLDCWAMVGDVLSFYQERIANEGYLRTATEPESLTRLGRLVGYTPRPPLGSSTYLAYTLGPDAKSVIPAGAGAKSVPGQGELPQTFETTEALIAREEWNTLAVRMNQPSDITANGLPSLAGLTVDGVAANLKAGDRLLFLFDRRGATVAGDVRVVKESTPDFLANRTVVTLAQANPVDPFTTLVDTLTTAVSEARKAVEAKKSAFTAQVDVDYLEPFLTYLTGLKTPAEVFAYPGVPRYLARLHEEQAIGAGQESCAVEQWLTGKIGAVIDAGNALVAMATTLTRQAPGELQDLVALGHDLLCPYHDEELGVSRSAAEGECGCEQCGCDRAAALVALTPVLPFLRREPSRPPRRARDLEVAVSDQFRADSDVHAKLLIAADPRLAPTLHRAWANQQIAPPPPLSELQVLRVKAATVHLDAPDKDLGTVKVFLDAVYTGIAAGSWVALEPQDSAPAAVTPEPATAQVLQVGQEPYPAGPTPPAGMPVTTVVLATTDLVSNAKYVVWAQGDPLTPLGDAITDPISGDQIELSRTYDGLSPGRWLVVSGERADVLYTSGVPGTELAMVAGIRQWVDPDLPGDAVRTTLFLTTKLAYTYRRDTVAVYGNVVGATQGETRNEILGGGDAGQTGQTFPLRQVLPTSPLNWQPADNPLGAQDSLVARVDGVAWHETDGLIWSGPQDHSYLLQPGDDGSTSVVFGDGVHGSRLPAGIENVTATYRVGAGRSGNVPAGKITQLAAQPLGVTAVTNPLAATGGADGDGPEDIRSTVPLRMLALDRLVSVPDYENFTRARAGIGKASARKLWDSAREVVHVTIAGIGDVPIDPLSGLFTTLEQSLTDFGDLGVPVEVSVREHVLIVLRAGIKVLPDYSWDLVQPAVSAAVAAELGFAARELGEPAYLSRVVSVMQGVPGVDYVDVDLFHGIPGDVSPIDLATIAGTLNVVDTAVQALPARFEEVTAYGPFGSLTAVATRYGLTVEELVSLNRDVPDPEHLYEVNTLTVFRGIRPAQLALLPADVPEALTLRRIL